MWDIWDEHVGQPGHPTCEHHHADNPIYRVVRMMMFTPPDQKHIGTEKLSACSFIGLDDAYPKESATKLTP
jgi:hypothetical protein